MARGLGESPARSPASQLQQVDFPATRQEIVETAADNEAPAEVINFLKCLPGEQYQSLESALRDFAEAERRFGLSNQALDGPDRRNIGRPSGEDAPAGVSTRHP
jgi:hypothetical protein